MVCTLCTIQVVLRWASVGLWQHTGAVLWLSTATSSVWPEGHFGWHVVLGDTVSLPDEEIRWVSWPHSQRGWCVLSKHLVQDKNRLQTQASPQAESSLIPHYPWTGMRRKRWLCMFLSCREPWCSLLNASHKARSSLQSCPQVIAFNLILNTQTTWTKKYS